jgi:TPP-dependent pyruvate/acetoin dehydrogenase alpha subunit
LADGKALDAIARELSSAMKAAVEYAVNAPYPESNEVTQHVYA